MSAKDMKIIMFLSVLIIVSIVSEACRKSRGGCSGVEKYYRMEKLKVNIYRKTSGSTIEYSLLNDSGSIKSSEFHLRLNILYNFYLQWTPKRTFSFLPLAIVREPCLYNGYLADYLKLGAGIDCASCL